jgi:two-component system, chemotaxis family, chemotaxis protein CheY
MTGRGTIVCVDDEQAVLNQLSTQLTRRFGSTHVVECAESGEEALRLIQEVFAVGGRVEIVICDQVMPGLKGDRFLETVHTSHPEIMKVLLTGQGGLDSAIHAINHGGLDRYIEKPWESEDLAMSVHSLLSQYRLRRDLKLHHERLERRSRHLQALHEVGRDLAAATDAGRVLARVSQAAASLAGASRVATVASLGAAHPVFWSGTPEAFLDEKGRRSIVAALGRNGEEPDDEGVPPDLAALALRQGARHFGFILLPDPGSIDTDAREALAILADQTAASLENVRLVEERVASERLSAIGGMISSLAHDMRNPMSAIKGYAGMFEDFDLPRDREKNCARLIREECDRMSAMIEEVLEFSRGAAIRLSLAPVSLADLASQIRRSVEAGFQARRIEFKTDLRYAGPVLVDLDRMKRAVLNIAHNSLDAMEAGGAFTFASSASGESVEIALEDTGRGIPDEVQPRVFEPFFTFGKARGTGLGMTIARRIVEAHGGSIGLESRVGKGTRLVLTLPRPRPEGD